MNKEEKKAPLRRHNGPPMSRVVEKPKDFVNSLKRLIHELKKYKVGIIVAILLSIISSVLAIYSPTIIKNLTNEITYGLFVNKSNLDIITNKMKNNGISEPIVIDGVEISIQDQYQLISINKDNKNVTELMDELPDSVKQVLKPKMNFEVINGIVKLLIVIYIFSALSNYFQALIMAIVSNKFARRLRESISEKINRLPLEFFDRNRLGDTLSRVSNDVDLVAQSLNQSLSSFISNVVLLFGTLIMMFVTNYILALTAIASTIIGFIGVSIILKNSQKYFKSRQEELGKLNSHIEEVYSGLKVIRLYNAKDKFNEEFDKLNNRVMTVNFKSQFLSGIMMPLMHFVGNLGFVSVSIVGALLAIDGKIEFGVIVAFMTYVRLFTNPLSQIAQSFTSMQSSIASSERVFEFLDEKEMEDDSDKKSLKLKDIKGNVELKNVNFSYKDSDKKVIKDFSFKADKGKKIAIVGPTGAGKTTIVNLLMKFYDIDDGEILIDGVDISTLKRENIHDLFTMVLQDTWLFEGTIMENLVYNRKNISKKEVIDVCKKVGLDYFIRTLPKGYDSLISEADTLSIGQKQLLTIARAMLSETPFLILDEATSNVDTRTEELVQKAMDELAKDKTSFIIAHRLSTIKNADLILVVNDGKIIEQGKHNDLLKLKGFYSDLYNSQFEL